MSLVTMDGLRLAARDTVLVDDLAFTLDAGETLALIGESGSGKTLSALALLDLLPAGVRRQAGRIAVDGIDVGAATAAQLGKLRGGVCGMIFQEPQSSLNPLQRIGAQIDEAIRLHRRVPRAERRARVQNLLREVGLDPARMDEYPHHFSGGQRQRVMIAMALANDPKLLIADEPTTALDVLLARQILDLIRAAQRRRGLGVLLITHDIGVVRGHADRVIVLSRGRAVEAGAAAAVLASPCVAQTRDLLAARGMAPPPPVAQTAPVVLAVRDLDITYAVRRGILRRRIGGLAAARDVGFDLHAGETIGLVGESGSGKTSIGLALARLLPFSGTVLLAGRAYARAHRRDFRRGLQIVFQDPYGSLNPRFCVAEIVAEGLLVHEPALSRASRDARVAAALEAVGLGTQTLGLDGRHRYPHEFSGGQRARIAIARALVLNPAVLILDEPTSALDAAVQAGIITLLRRLQAERGLAYLFISHDLAVVRALAHRILVLKEGSVVEQGLASAVLAAPREAYTRSLVAAAALAA